MKLSLEEKTKLIILSERASELLVEILAEENSQQRITTKKDIDFNNTMTLLHYHCPLLAEAYAKMYNFIQEAKSKEEDLTYLKRLRKEDFGKITEGEADIIY